MRVVATTNRNLQTEIEKGNFREDLFYRLNVLTLKVPPLRERREDIPLLLTHFTRKGASAHGLSFSEQAVKVLQQHDFPGNVRELQNLVERLSILHGGERIGAEQAREVLTMTPGQRRDGRGPLYEFGRSMRELLHDFERQIMLEAIAAHGNSKTAAAQALGTERSHFYKKCRQYGIGEYEVS